MSVSFSQTELTQIVRGRLLIPARQARVSGISTDTRTLKSGDLFVPLSGDNFDGQKFIPKAFSQGAVATLLRSKNKNAAILKSAKGKGRGVIAVADPLKAYGALAAAWRQQFLIPVLAVTGSNGKTSTKELLASVLGQQYSVLKTEGNLNNQVGLPRTLLGLQKKHQAAVLEMGMNHPGEIRTLAQIAKPTVGMITNVGRAHLQGLRTTHAIAKAKGELLQELHSGGLAILNRDDAHYRFLRSLSKAPVVTIGLDKKADLQARHIKPLWVRGRPAGTSFDVLIGRKQERFLIPSFGRPFVANALMAIAAGLLFSVPLAKMKRGLRNHKGVSGRLEGLPLKKMWLFNDTYNANPDSMMASLQIMKELKASSKQKRRLIAVLGGMGELGSFEKKGHRLVGKSVARNGVDLLITVGPKAADIATGARQAGLAAGKIFSFSSKKEAATALSKQLRKGDLILVKGSRFMKMEELVALLKKKIMKGKF